MFVIILALVTSANARLGETEKECVKRYGEPIEKSKRAPAVGVRKYQKDGLFITVDFVKGKSVGIAYENKEQVKRIPAKPVGLTKEQREKLMTENAGGVPWNFLNGSRKLVGHFDPYVFQWRHAKLRGVYTQSTRRLTVRTIEYEEIWKEEEIRRSKRPQP
jgi:hypothetical protein